MTSFSDEAASHFYERMVITRIKLTDKRYMPVILAMLCTLGLLLILLPGKTSADGKESVSSDGDELAKYGASLEERFGHIVSEMEGAGEAKVMITFDSSFEKVYAGNARVEEGSSGGKTSEKQLVLAGSGTSSETPVLLKEMCPRVRGVAVICDGAGDKEVERKIKEAAVSLFGISEFKVYVAKGEASD